MSADAAEPLLRMLNVSAKYGDALAVEGVTLDADARSIIAIIGVNGAGKTTTLKLASGVLSPSSGEIVFDGEDVTGLPTRELVRRGIAHCPEGRRVFPHMSVEENLEVGAFLVADRASIASRIEHVYDLFPRLLERRGQKAGTLSGGEQQMLAIGRALMASPRLLLLDEPTLGLAPRIIRQVADLIRRIRGEGVAVVLVEQNAQMALELADRAYLMDGGRVRLEGPAEELRSSKFVREAYLGI